MRRFELLLLLAEKGANFLILDVDGRSVLDMLAEETADEEVLTRFSASLLMTPL